MAAHLHTLYNAIDPRDERTKQAEFLAAFTDEQSIVAAAAKSNISVTRVKQWRLRDLDFEMAFNELAETILLQAEEELYKRAVVGELTPVYQGGQEVGKVRKKSDILLMFFLKANMPDKYNKTDEPKGKLPNDGAVLILPSNGRELPNQISSEMPVLPQKREIPVQDKSNARD